MLGCVFGINAQLYYFIQAGEEIKPGKKITLFYTSGSSAFRYFEYPSKISAKLYSDSSYWDNWMDSMLEKKRKSKNCYEYDSSLSTGSYRVYRQPSLSERPGYYYTELVTTGYDYFAISNDGSTAITWYQRKNSDEVERRTYWERVDSDVLNQDPHDFLR